MLSHRRLRWKRYIVIRLLTVGMVGFPTTKKVFVASLLITSAYIWAFRPVQTVTKMKSFMVATVLSGQTLLQSILNVTVDSEIVEDDNLTVEEREVFRKANGNLAMGKYLILVVANMGHREFALNLIASFHRNHNEKFLVVCLDRLLYGSLVNASEGSHAALVPETWLPRFNLTLNEASFGSKDYSPITQAKMVITNQFVQRSYTVFFHDVDLVWLSPFVLEYIDRVEPKTEVIYMVDIANHWNNRFNTGFYVVRPTDGVKRMFTEILSLQANKTDMMDGDAMVVSFNLNSRCKQLSSAPLDKCLFPCGKIYHHDKFNQRIGVKPFIYHANFMIGMAEKKASFQQHQMWYI